MVTPGVAGGLVMLIANSLGLKFNFGNNMPFLVLALSFLVGAIVFNDKTVNVGTRAILYIINSLIIFSIAAGSNKIGEDITTTPTEEVQPIIKPIGQLEKKESIFLFSQLEDSTAIKKKILVDQVSTTSIAIQAIQNSLVRNNGKYNQPQKKLQQLNGINESLLSVHGQLKKETNYSNENVNLYKTSLLEIQHNIGVLQKAMLLEEKSTRRQNRFFKSWTN